MDDFGQLIFVLEKSVEKHGRDKIVTLGHLLNLLLKVRKDIERDEYYSELNGSIIDSQ